MPPIRQYVNLPVDLDEHHGNLFWLSIKIKEKKKGDSEGKLVYLFLEPDGKNLEKKYLPMSMRAAGFMFNPPDRELVTVANQKAYTMVTLSKAGGDKFKFKAGKKANRSGAVDAKVEVEIWRKIFLRYGFMQPRGAQTSKYPVPPMANMGTVKSELEKVFVEMETQGPYQVKYEPWVNTSDPITNLESGRPPLPFSEPSTQMVFVDRIGKSSYIQGGPWTFSTAKLKGSKIFDWTIPGGKYTWPDDDAWIAGKIEFLDENGAVSSTIGTVRPYVTKLAGHTHPEGTATKKIQMNFSSMTGWDPWLNQGKGSMRVTLFIWIIDDAAMGLAWPSPPRILIATRSPTRYTPNSTLENTVVHEIGHNLGLGVRWVAQYDDATSAFTSYVKNAQWYDNKNGGVGKHCKTGADLDADNHYQDGTCTMLHYVNGVNAYCPECALHVKRANLRKLGANAVWPSGEREEKQPGHLMLAAAVAAVCCAGGCKNDSRSVIMPSEVTAEDRRFFVEVTLGSGNPCTLTPEFKDQEYGIKIAAPRSIEIATEMRVPICASAKFSADVQNSLPARFWQNVSAVVLDADGNRLAVNTLGDPTPLPEDYDPAPRPPPSKKPPGAASAPPPPSGNAPSGRHQMLPQPAPPPAPPPMPAAGGEDRPPAPAPEGSAVELTDGDVTQYRNFDLLEVVELTAKPATYHVFLTQAEFQSNTITITFVPPAHQER